MFESQTGTPPKMQQLPLPLFNLNQSANHLLSAVDPLRPHQVWNNLSPTIQTQARCEMVRIMREVLHEAFVR